MEFKTAYGPKERVQFECTGPSMTKQDAKQECDINFIVQRYQKTGLISHRKLYEGGYGEFMDIDFHEAMNIVASASSMFESLPSGIRARFENDPGQFVKFLQDEENFDEMVELGLAHPRDPEPVPQKVEVVNPPEPVAEE
mgnify:CR=1 FL=1